MLCSLRSRVQGATTRGAHPPALQQLQQYQPANWTFDRPLRVCFATEAVAYTSICEANFPPPGFEGQGLPELHSNNECPAEPYCGFDFALWTCVPDTCKPPY